MQHFFINKLNQQTNYIETKNTFAQHFFHIVFEFLTIIVRIGIK